MAKNAGTVGAIYSRKAYIQGTGIAFNDNDPSADTITDSGNGFVTAGFEAGDHITVSGSTNNSDTFLIASVAAGTIVLDAADALTTEGASPTITIVEAVPGTEHAAFFNWSIDDAGEAIESTTFGSNGWREYEAGLRNWTATAEKFWVSDDDQDDWLLTEKIVRFFTIYNASPDVTTVNYYEGNALITGLSTNAPVGELVTQTLTFTGTPKATLQGTGIAFVDNDPSADTITDSGSGFLTDGFEAGDKITVSGSTDNDGDYTIDSLTAGVITLIAADALTTEAAGDNVSIATLIRLKTRSTAWPTGG